MLVYSATKKEFIRHVRENRIEQLIENEISRKLNRKSARTEVLAWKNSLQYMHNVLCDDEIPDKAGVAVEYNVPLTSRRVDFILTGKDEHKRDTAVIVELKQWSDVETTDKDAVVKTLINHAIRETAHPSYQAWSYSAIISEYNETVRKEQIILQPCAYLHNLKSREAINSPFYREHIEKAPVFTSYDAHRLTEFLKKFVKYGDSDNIMYRIEHGVIKPSKTLADSVVGMLKGNTEFILVDEQKIVYEAAIDLASKGKNGRKQTLIVKGGPGTGKSVVAINLLVEFTKREMLAQYVSKNAAPREVFKAKLKGDYKKSYIDHLFRGSGGYFDVQPNFFDAVIVDEAHRLNEKSGLYRNLGENQIKELIAASKTSIFFIDEDQRVTFDDIGSVEKIIDFAHKEGSEITILELNSQFRCNGSDGYLAWLDHALQIRETANLNLDGIDYDFKIFDDPNKLRSEIFKKNQTNNRSRIVAGYCWDWISKKNSNAYDIVIPDFGFKARWNLTTDGSLWLISPMSINEIGCIHTCQGLEVDYIGVIIGDDLIVREGQVITDAGKRSKMDRSVRGYQTLLKRDPKKAREMADLIIKNTYRTLMTRGLKGCYIYCTDPETRKYFQQYFIDQPVPDEASESFAGLSLPVVSWEEARPYEGYVPVFDIAAAAGSFSAPQYAEEFMWVKLPEEFATREGMFVIRVIGESMNKRIPNGSWCLFRTSPAGTRNGRIVLVQHRTIEDPDHGGCYTVKRYRSEKYEAEGGLLNSRIILSPETNAYGYEDMILDDTEEDVQVIGEFVAVLD